MKLTLLFFLSSFLLTGQNIKGIVMDAKTYNSLESVTVYYKKHKVGTLSNIDGKFTLSTKLKISTKDTLQFSMVGYHTKKLIITALSKNNYTVYLSKKTERLDDVIINAKNTLNSSIKFSKLAPLELGVSAFGSSLINNKIYVYGGDASNIEGSAIKTFEEVSNIPNPSFQYFITRSRYNYSWENYSKELQVYSIDNNTWTESDLKFKNRAYHNVNFHNNNLYVLGGKSLSPNGKFEYLDNTIEIYNLETDQLLIDYTNPHQAVNFASFIYQDNIIVMGGSIKLKKNGDKVYTDTSHIYNLTSGNWFELPEMIHSKETNGALVGHKIYLIGGFNKTELSSIESYDLVDATWKKEGDLFYGLERPALANHKNIIYIFSNTKLILYNTSTNLLEEYHIDLNLKQSKLHYYNNKLYVIGGYIEDTYSKTASKGVYEIDLNELIKTEIQNSKKLD